MGTINYGSSDYITMGLNVDNLWCDSFYSENEPEFETMQLDREELWEEVEKELNKYGFCYYHVVLKPGYYEGFYLDIENNYSVCYDFWQDRREANKEITQLKRLLLALADFGMVSCMPGWCTGYEDYNGTIKAIEGAIKGMREEVKSIPTWTQYERERRCKAV